MPFSAIEYAYNLWRRFPDDISAQLKLISLIQHQERMEVEASSRINCNSAVIYKEKVSNMSRTHIIEIGPAPQSSRDEYPLDHKISKLLMEKKEGDSFSVNNRNYTISSINNKYEFVAGRLLREFSITFPENSLLQELRIDSEPNDTSGTKEVSGEVKEFMQKDDAKIRNLEDLYQKNALPVLRFAKLMGKSVLETMLYFANSRNLNIHVCLGFPLEHKAAFDYLSNNCDVILDETAIATIFMLGLHKDLGVLPYNLFVPEAAIYELRRIVNNAVSLKRIEGYLGMVDGNLFFHKFSPSEHALWINSLEELISSLQRYCTILGGRAILDIETETRSQLINIMGTANADAIAIARQKGIAYWTDDLFSGVLSISNWSIKRVWTKIILEKTLKINRNFISKYTTSSKYIFLWGYEFTSMNIQIIISICKDARWDLDDWRMQHIEQYLVKVGAIHPKHCHITSMLIVKIWHRCPKKSMAIKVITNILDKIGRHISGPMIARPIYRGLIPLPKTRNIRTLKRMLRSWRQHGK